jgi:hypothetical protein
LKPLLIAEQGRCCVYMKGRMCKNANQKSNSRMLDDDLGQL